MSSAVEVFYDAGGTFAAPLWAKLSTAMAAGDSTLHIISTPANNPTAASGVQVFRVGIDLEQMLVTLTSGTTWTVTRAVNGTAAAAHNVNADVLPILAAPSFNAGGRLGTTATTEVAVSGVLIGTRQRINIQSGANINVAAVDNPGGQSVDVTVATISGTPGGLFIQDHGVLLAPAGALNFIGTGVTVGANVANNSYDVLINGGSGGGGVDTALTIMVNTPTGPQTLQAAISDLYTQAAVTAFA
jgi:hypothetical protein